MTYADASVIAGAYLVDEPTFGDARRRILDGDDAVVTSQVTTVEIAAALRAAHRAGRIGPPERLLRRFDADTRAGGPVGLLTLDANRSLPHARTLAERYPLEALDAIHIAVALDLPGEITFLTADRRQADAAGETGLTVELLG